MRSCPPSSPSLSAILGLLYTASERFTGVEGVVRHWVKPSEAARAEQDWLSSEPSGSIAPLSHRDSGVDCRQDDPSILEETVALRAWKSSRRSLCVDERETRATVQPSSARNTLTKIGTLGGLQMLQPFDLIPHMVLSPIEKTTFLQRPAFRVRATPRRQEIDVADTTLWMGANEYELLIDEERGVILRLTAFNNGAAFAGEEFIRIDFAGPLLQSTARWERITNVVSLLYGAQSGFTTVSASTRRWYKVEEEKRRGWLWRLEKTGRLLTKEDYRIRFWAEPPSRFRQERERHDSRETAVVVIDGEVWWSSLSSRSVVTNARMEQIDDSAKVSVLEKAVGREYQDAEDAILSHITLNPSWLISGLWMEAMGQMKYIGRAAILVRGEPIEEEDSDWYWWDGADEYQMLVDAERGILLRIGVFRNGEEFAGAEVTSIEFDRPIPDEIFRFTPPSGMVVNVNPPS